MSQGKGSQGKRQEDRQHVEVEGGAADRLAFFSDAVVAIALTLLALELPVPDGLSASELWASLRSHLDSYLAFCLSFLVIAAHWGAHHGLLRWVRRADARLRTLNTVWLFTIVITPFASRIISEGEKPPPGVLDTSDPLRFAMYAAVQVGTNLTFLLMAMHLDAAGLLRPGTPPDALGDAYRAAVVIGSAFAVSIPLFAVTPYAWIVWIVVPTAGRIHRRYRRHRARTGKS
jgi:uncharacterized membrane protein